MTDDRVESRRDDQPSESGYEPPGIHDFGLVREVTHGSTGGSGDASAQKFD
nr:hypothetical protein [Kibdelosporangium sp. MJ126-NF4]CTQ96958.1 hypothetical protein [Kibdelosporangium sp. MJ126-NF4]